MSEKESYRSGRYYPAELSDTPLHREIVPEGEGCVFCGGPMDLSARGWFSPTNGASGGLSGVERCLRCKSTVTWECGRPTYHKSGHPLSERGAISLTNKPDNTEITDEMIDAAEAAMGRFLPDLIECGDKACRRDGISAAFKAMVCVQRGSAARAPRQQPPEDQVERVAALVDPLTFQLKAELSKPKSAGFSDFANAQELTDERWPIALGKAREIIAALSPSDERARVDWSDDLSTAPVACHVLACRRDPTDGEWVVAVVVSPPCQPFTHWAMLPAMPGVHLRAEQGEGA